MKREKKQQKQKNQREEDVDWNKKRIQLAKYICEFPFENLMHKEISNIREINILKARTK